jgi:hypothetical protein
VWSEIPWIGDESAPNLEAPKHRRNTRTARRQKPSSFPRFPPGRIHPLRDSLRVAPTEVPPWWIEVTGAVRRRGLRSFRGDAIAPCREPRNHGPSRNSGPYNDRSRFRMFRADAFSPGRAVAGSRGHGRCPCGRASRRSAMEFSMLVSLPRYRPRRLHVAVVALLGLAMALTSMTPAPAFRRHRGDHPHPRASRWPRPPWSSPPSSPSATAPRPRAARACPETSPT